MANRSKKIVISARIAPSLKAAIDLASSAKNETIVQMLEELLRDGLNEIWVPNPFQCGVFGDKSEVNFMTIFDAIWTEHPVLFKLRAGGLGAAFAGQKIWAQAGVVLASDYFKGEHDVYADLNGSPAELGEPPRHYVNLDLVETEWPLIEGYISFLDTNRNLSPSYDVYKQMVENS